MFIYFYIARPRVAAVVEFLYFKSPAPLLWSHESPGKRANMLHKHLVITATKYAILWATKSSPGLRPTRVLTGRTPPLASAAQIIKLIRRARTLRR